MMDALAIEAAEAAVHCGYPAGAGAVLIVELDGPPAEVEAQFAAVEALCREHGAFEIRIAADDAERALFWKGRKSAFAAVGRISPDYIVQDGVIPRTALPEVLRRIAELSPASTGSGSPTSSTPATATCTRWCCSTTPSPGEAERAEAVSRRDPRPLRRARRVDHRRARRRRRTRPSTCRSMFTDDDLDTMQLVRCAFDPRGLANPGKVFPTPAPVRRGAGPAQGRPSAAAAGIAEVF